MAFGYKNCYWDSWNKVMWLLEQDSDTWVKYDYQPFCYVQSNNPTGIKDLHKHDMKRMDYKDKSVIQNLKNAKMIIAESDLSPEVKFMHERYDKVELKPDITKWHIGYYDIEVASGSKYYDDEQILVKDLKTKEVKEWTLIEFDRYFNHDYDHSIENREKEFMVFDIEEQEWKRYTDSCYVSNEFPASDKAYWPINLISVYSSKTKKNHTFSILDYDFSRGTCPKELLHQFKDEVSMLKGFFRWMHEQKFDIITGWNSVNYDLPYIINRCERLREKLGVHTEWERALSPMAKMPNEKKNFDRKLADVDLGSTFTIPGLYHLDYMELYKTFADHPPMASFALNFVCQMEIGKGKLDYEGKINETYKIDATTFTDYNRVDVFDFVELEEKKQIFPLILEYAFDCVVTLDKIFNKVPTSEGYILKFLHNEGKVLNDKPEKHTDWWRNEKAYIVKKDGQDYYQNTEWEEDAKGYPDFKKYTLKKRYMDGDRSQELLNEVLDWWHEDKKRNKSPWQVFEQEAQDDFRTNNLHPFEEFGVKAGYCFDDPGRYDDCMSFDITSSYPHHIMQFNISPETVCPHPTKEQIESGEVILTDVNNVGFYRTDDAIIPSIVKKVFAERKEYKRLKAEAGERGDNVEKMRCHNIQLNKKNIINSLYGVCLSPTFHLYNIDCARAICRCARVTLRDWLTRYLNEYYKSPSFIKDVEKYFGIEFKDKSPIAFDNHLCSAVHNDTDSVYFTVHELREKLAKEGHVYKTEDEIREFFKHVEDIFEDFFVKILEIRAQKSKTTNKIKFNRENIFTSMYCFAKKLYIGKIIDSEGDLYPVDEIDLSKYTEEEKKALPHHWLKHPEGPKHKIMGVPIKRSDMPDFCKEAAEKLAFDICSGMNYEAARDSVIETYKQFCEASTDVVASKKSISNYKKYIPHDIDYYLKNGLVFETGMTFNAKCSLAYNYIIAKNKFKLAPINNNTKFNYMYVKPNEYNIEAIAYIGEWPQELANILEVDYETMFRKSYIPLFEKMFRISKWIGPKETVPLEVPGMFEFFC